MFEIDLWSFAVDSLSRCLDAVVQTMHARQHKSKTDVLTKVPWFSLEEAKCLALNRRNTYKTSIIVNSILNMKTETQWTLKWTLKWNNLIRTHTQKNGMGGLGRKRSLRRHTPKIPACSVSRPRQTLVASLSRVIGRTAGHAVARAITVAFSGEKQVHTLCNEHL